mgnify:CR=1 FL=1
MIKSYTFKIEAENEKQTDEIANALNVIYQKIENKDLIWVAAKIQEDPKVINKVINIANNPIVKNLFLKK